MSPIGRAHTGKQVSDGLGLGVAAAANILDLVTYETVRRRNPKEERSLDQLRRLIGRPGDTFVRPLFGRGLPGEG